MGVKGAMDSKAQEKWNRFRAQLVETAGLPHTALVRLCFINADGQKHELQNMNDLQSISKQYGTVRTDGDRRSISLQIAIEVLALNISEYRMRFKYEQNEFLKQHEIESMDSEHCKERLSQFVLSPLTTTNAVIRKGFRFKPSSSASSSSASSSISPAIDIMDMLNVNQSPSNNADSKPQDALSDPVLVEVVDSKPIPNEPPHPRSQSVSDAVNAADSPSKPLPPTSSTSLPPKIESQPITNSFTASSSNISNHPKRRLSAQCLSPLVSSEEMRYQHYIAERVWDRTIGIRNLPPSMDKEAVLALCTQFGPVRRCRVEPDCVVVDFYKHRAAERAVIDLDGVRQFGLDSKPLSVALLKMKSVPDSQIAEESKEDGTDSVDNDDEQDHAQNECTKLLVTNWPSSIGIAAMKKLFSSHGQVVTAELINECGFIEFASRSEAERAIEAVNGLQIGSNPISVSFWSDEMADILGLNRDQTPIPNAEPSPSSKDRIAEKEHSESQNVEGSMSPHVSRSAVTNKSIFEVTENENEQSWSKRTEPRSLEVPSDSVPKTQDIAALVNDEKRSDLKAILHDDHINGDNDGDGDDDGKWREKRKGSIHRRSSSRGIGRDEHRKNEPEIEEPDDDDENESDSDQSRSSSSDSTSSSSSTSYSSSSSESSRKKKRKKRRKKSERKMSKKERAKMKRKERRRRRSKRRKLREREKRVDVRVEALSECLEKFTNLMASVSQSALIMQQSVAAMSQMKHHPMSHPQSVMYDQSMNRLLPNQPMYTSFIPSFQGTLPADSLTPMGPQQPGSHGNANDDQSEMEPKSNSNSKSPTSKSSKSRSMSMLEVINQLSNTQGGPGGAELGSVQGQRSGTNVIAGVTGVNVHGHVGGTMNVMSSPVAAEQQRLIQQQQQLLALQQQALQLQALQSQQKPQQAVGAKASHFVNANYPKPVLFANGNTKAERGGVSSSPILHSTHHSSPSMQQQQHQQQQQQPVLNMLNERNSNSNRQNAVNLSGSGCSGTNEQQPGTQPAPQSKSKIFEHKKALRNVSPEMDLKLKELNAMGYTNRTFNLVLLKQENGDLPKVIENLKQFYSNNQ